MSRSLDARSRSGRKLFCGCAARCSDAKSIACDHVIARLVGFESARDPGFNIGDSDLCATHCGPVQIADAAQNASLIGLRGDGAAEDHREQRNHQQITARKKLTPTRFFHILISSDREMCPITSLCLCERGLHDAEMRAFVMSKSL